MPQGGAGGLGRGRGVGDGQDIRQVDQCTTQLNVVADQGGESHAFAAVGDRLRPPRDGAQVDPSAEQQPAELLGANVKGLTEDKGLGGEPVSIGRSAEYRHDSEFLQSAHQVGIGIGAQDLDRGSELITGFGVSAPQAQCPPGDGLGAGGGAVLPVVKMVSTRTLRVVDGRGIVHTGDGGRGGAFPQHPGALLLPWLPAVTWSAAAA